MDPAKQESADREQRINDLVALYLEACDRGERPDTEVWLHEHREFAQDLRQFLSDSGALPDDAATIQALMQDLEPVESDALPPLDDFRLLRELGRGGMGVVFEAEQISLRRRVAVKSMTRRQPGPAVGAIPSATMPISDDLQDRFAQEAELTGALQHPGIVPVYVAGTAIDGQPFYAMRLIDGKTLQEAIDEYYSQERSSANHFTTLEFRQLLRHFVDVCHAIDYAHSRQIIHRDIKPLNVMLGRFGETLVVDWGLAKNAACLEPTESSTESDSPANRHINTEHGARVGTPAFMSPEQFAGRGENVGTAMDIYGLGATLYCLLTGRPPNATNALATTLIPIGGGNSPLPRFASFDAPPALQAICRHAMALDPRDRYSTSRELAEEIERWLADEPVKVYRERYWSRLQRFLRRHQTISTSVSAAALVAAICMAIGAWLLDRANERERIARGDADKNFRLAHQAVDDYFTRVADDDRLRQADLRPLRADLLRSARDYYDRFIAERGNDPALRAELGTALGNLAGIVVQTEPKANALALYERAIAVHEELIAVSPEVTAYWDELSANYNDLGLIYQEMGRLGEAEVKLLAAVEICERRAEHDSSPIENDRRLAMMHSNLGMLYRIGGDLGTSEEHHLRANAMWDKLFQTPANTKVVDYQSEAAQSRYLLGNLYFTRRDLDKAEECYRDSIQRYEKVVDTAPALVHLYKEMPGVIANLARIYFRQQKFSEAEQLLRDVLPRQEQFVRSQPSLTQLRFDVGCTCAMLSQACRGTNNPGDAEVFSRRAIDVLAAVAEEHPDIIQYRSSYASAYNDLGMSLDQLDRHEEARAAYAQGITLTERLLLEHRDMPLEREELAAFLVNVGNSWRASGRDDEALRWYDRGEGVLRDLPKASADVVAERMAIIHLGRASALLRLKRFEDSVLEAEKGNNLSLPTERNAVLMEVKAEALARLGRTQAAVDQIELLRSAGNNADQQFQVARLMSLSAAGSSDPALHDQLLDQTVTMLRGSKQLSIELLDRLANDEDCSALASSIQFQEFRRIFVDKRSQTDADPADTP